MSSKMLAHYRLQCQMSPCQKYTNIRAELVNVASVPENSQEFGAGHMTAQRLIVHYVGGSARAHLVPVMIMASRS